MPPNSIFAGPITNLLSVLCILITKNIFTCSQKGGRKALMVSKLDFFVHFPNDGAANMAMKGLTLPLAHG